MNNKVLVDKDDVIRVIGNIDWYHISKEGKLEHKCDPEHDAPLMYADEIFSAIELMPAIKKASFIGKWTPVSEGLPKENGLYWVTDHRGQLATYMFNKEGNSEEYWKRCVKAWMPRPEPYKEELKSKIPKCMRF